MEHLCMDESIFTTEVPIKAQLKMAKKLGTV